MATFSEHCKDCLDQLGDEYQHVHEWLDALFVVMGPKHRSARHHIDGVAKVKEMWGDEAAKAAEIHVKRDCNGKVPTVAESQLWSLFGAPCDDKGTEIIEGEKDEKQV